VKTSRHLWLWIPWALFAAAAIGWIAYWNVVADTARDKLSAWAAEQRANGAEASLGRVSTHGFPIFMRLEIANAAYAPARGGWRMETDRLDLHVDLLNTAHIMLEAKAPIAITRRDGSRSDLSARALLVSLRTRGDVLAEGGIEADDLTLDDPAKDGVLSVRKLVINTRPDPRDARNYQIAFSATQIGLARPVRVFEAFGQEIASLGAASVIEQPALLFIPDAEDPLRPWREAGGLLRFEALNLTWGPLTAAGQGQGGLDAERRLQGALELNIAEPGPAFGALAQGQTLSDDTRNALRALSVGYQVTGEEIEANIEARDGVLTLEGFPVRVLSPVY
jgi:hypothetical protein